MIFLGYECLTGNPGAYILEQGLWASWSGASLKALTDLDTKFADGALSHQGRHIFEFSKDAHYMSS